MSSIFQNSDDSPFHISVGALLVNGDGKIRAHYRTEQTTPAEFRDTMGGLSETYTLMRETVENGETLEQAVIRGLKEEFGAEGEIARYLGSLQIMVHAKTRSFQKTTLYFQVRLISEGERPPDDGEGHTELVWVTPELLLERMRQQGENTAREDLDESRIIESYMTYGR